MNDQAELKQSFQRVQRALKKMPSLGQHTHRSTTKIKGLSCEIREGNWQLKVDMPEMAGGTGKSPTPGVLGRAALGSCLAIGYQLTAARMEVPVNSLTVDVYADNDDAGLYRISDTPPGYSEVRYCISVESSAPETAILAMLDEADQHSPWLDIFTRSVRCRRQLRIVQNDVDRDTGGADPIVP